MRYLRGHRVHSAGGHPHRDFRDLRPTSWPEVMLPRSTPSPADPGRLADAAYSGGVPPTSPARTMAWARSAT
jgi:hypothetical protein